MKVCYWPGRERGYTRTRVMLRAMQLAGIEVFDCSSQSRSRLRYLSGLFKFLKYKNRSDLVCIGFLGHFLVPLARCVTRKKILFDGFVSLYRTMVEDRQRFREGSLLAKAAGSVDRTACRLADKVFLDTEQDIAYFTQQYGFAKERFCRLYASTDDTVMYPRSEGETEAFAVEFHSEFQALHGAIHIVEAAALLRDVRFMLIGDGQQKRTCEQRAAELGLQNVEFIPPVAFSRLPEYMAKASICLGIFGNTPKAKMVIPIKVYEAMAMKKPLVTADTPAVRELLTDGETAILCEPGNPRSLADAIAALRDDPSMRTRIAENAYGLFRARCCPEVLGKTIADAARELLGNAVGG